MARVLVTTGSCSAELYLQGAHLTRWQPSGHSPVLFLSTKSSFAPGKAIRGGVPIIFPWFGPRTKNALSDRTDGPAHGFARTSDWQLTSATMDGEALVLILDLGPSALSSSFGYDNFLLTYKLTFGESLQLELIVDNSGTAPFIFEEALHTYLAVGDVYQVSVTGLADCEYLDKSDGYKRKRQDDPIITLAGETDRPYVNTHSQVDLEDPSLQRRLCVAKENSATTVIWNPWSKLAAGMADMEAEGWKHMTCIETANAGENAIRLEPGAQHTMLAKISVRDFDH
ncbi:MAG: D-hexose-6-phosphate mutarotase [Cyanobacteria bacterium REEB67]|nr:D-hexose-6-phosphate mutarotase [Cyanobacteria bacterium REEB67]